MTSEQYDQSHGYRGLGAYALKDVQNRGDWGPGVGRFNRSIYIRHEQVGGQAWKAQGNCHGEPTDLFFAEKGEAEKMANARKYCQGCPVRWQCFSFGMGEGFGLWGGVSRLGAKEIKRARARGATWRQAIAQVTGIGEDNLHWVPDTESEQTLRD